MVPAVDGPVDLTVLKGLTTPYGEDDVSVASVDTNDIHVAATDVDTNSNSGSDDTCVYAAGNLVSFICCCTARCVKGVEYMLW